MKITEILDHKHWKNNLGGLKALRAAMQKGLKEIGIPQGNAKYVLRDWLEQIAFYHQQEKSSSNIRLITQPVIECLYNSKIEIPDEIANLIKYGEKSDQIDSKDDKNNSEFTIIDIDEQYVFPGTEQLIKFANSCVEDDEDNTNEDTSLFGKHSTVAKNRDFILDFSQPDDNVTRLNLRGTNLARFNGIYSGHGMFHIANDIPTIESNGTVIKLDGYFSPLTLREAQELEKATKPSSKRFNFHFIQDHPWLVGTASAGILIAIGVIITTTRPWEPNVYNYAFEQAKYIYGYQGLVMVEANAHFLDFVFNILIEFSSVFGLGGLVTAASLLIAYLSQLPPIQYGELPQDNNVLIEENELQKTNSDDEQMSKFAETESLLDDDEKTLITTPKKATAKFSNSGEKEKCNIAYVPWRGRNWLIRLQDNFRLDADIGNNNASFFSTRSLKSLSIQKPHSTLGNTSKQEKYIQFNN